MGIVTIEDFEGSGDLALFGEDWGQWRGILVEGCTIFATAKCAPKFAHSDFYEFKIASIDYLQTVKEKRIDRITIMLDSDAVDEAKVNDIQTILANDHGNVQLYFQIRDVEQNTNILLRAQERTIGVSKELIQFVEDTPKWSYRIN